MAKYRVIRVCGHEDVVSVSGPKKDRDRVIEREAGRMCPDCWKATAKSSPVAKFTFDGLVNLSIHDAYEIRMELKARGYQFNPAYRSWERRFAPGEQAAFTAELDSLAQLGVDTEAAIEGGRLLSNQEELQNILLATLRELRAGTMTATRKAELAERAKALLAAGGSLPAANAWAKDHA